MDSQESNNGEGGNIYITTRMLLAKAQGISLSIYLLINRS